MSYAKQDKVNERLHNESLTALEAVGAMHRRKLVQMLGKTKRELKLSIIEAYRMATVDGRWTIYRLRRSGALGKLQGESHSILEQFRIASMAAMKQAFNDIYKQSLLRHAWILDQVTPESQTVLIPHHEKLHEAAVQAIYLGKQASQMWAERWGMWIAAYRDALLHNVQLGALNESGIDDAVAEVDATKANTPSATLDTAMDRVYEYEGTYAISAGAQAVADLNNEMVEEEVWKTRGDLRVCDDCDANEGLTIEDTDGDIPLHPNCHCYWLLVPKGYADLLRSGDESDNTLAEQMLSRGLVPNSLVIRNDDGDVAAKAIVDFGKWTGGLSRAVTAQ